VLQRLLRWSICAEVARGEDEVAFHPGRALDRITPADVLAALRHAGQPVTLSSGDPEATIASELLAAFDTVRVAELSRTTFHDIVMRLDAPAEAPPAG
jgi:hypothetical protein